MIGIEKTTAKRKTQQRQGYFGARRYRVKKIPPSAYQKRSRLAVVTLLGWLGSDSQIFLRILLLHLL